MLAKKSYIFILFSKSDWVETNNLSTVANVFMFHVVELIVPKKAFLCSLTFTKEEVVVLVSTVCVRSCLAWVIAYF